MMKNTINKKFIISLIAALLLTIIMEIFAFNRKALFCSGDGNAFSLFQVEFAIEDITDYGSGMYKINEDSDAGCIYLYNVDYDIKNLHIVLGDRVSSDYVYSKSNVNTVKIFSIYSDGSEKLIGSADVMYGLDKSQYISVGNNTAPTVKIEFSSDTTKVLALNDIIANDSIPFEFNGLRFGVVLGVLVFVVLLLPYSPLHTVDFVTQKDWKKWAFITVSVVLVGGLGAISFKNGIIGTIFDPNKLFIPYDDCAEAWAGGQSRFLVTVSDCNVPGYAQKDGYYYNPVGILPVVIADYPVYCATGTHIPPLIYTLVLAVIYLTLMYFVLKKYVREINPELSLGDAVLMFILGIASGGVLIFISAPQTYFIESLYGMNLTLIGLLVSPSLLKKSTDDKNDLQRTVAASMILSLSILNKITFFAVFIVWAVIMLRKIKDNRLKYYTGIFIWPVFFALIVLCTNYSHFGTPFIFLDGLRTKNTYVYDFLFMVGIVIIAAFIYLLKQKKVFCYLYRIALTLAAVLSISVCVYLFFFGREVCLDKGNTELFYRIYYLFKI